MDDNTVPRRRVTFLVGLIFTIIAMFSLNLLLTQSEEGKVQKTEFTASNIEKITSENPTAAGEDSIKIPTVEKVDDEVVQTLK